MAAKLFNRVAALRHQAGLTQAELGKAVGVTPETIGAIENGRQDATLLTALRMAAILRAPVPNVFREQPFPQLVGSNGSESQPT